MDHDDRVDHPAERVVVDDYLLAIDQVAQRLTDLDARLTDTAQTEPYRTPVGWLRCFRGIDTLTAMLLLAGCTTSDGFRRRAR